MKEHEGRAMNTKLLGFLLMISISSISAAPFSLTSKTFKDGQPLPKDTGWKSGKKVPSLSWSGTPKGTKSFALICDDPDAPTKEPWVHWVVFNIPTTETSLTKPLGNAKTIGPIRQGINSYREIGYGGPHPPKGQKHRYYFKLYALDKVLDLSAGSTKKQLEAAMKGHILSSVQIMGTYKRS